MNWYAFKHPQLGKIELGGWDTLHMWSNVPPEFLEKEISPFPEWIVWHALISPKLAVRETKVTSLGGDSFRIRLVLQNAGGAIAGVMDRATHGQPGKYSFCCAENEAANPWEPLHVERGFAPNASTVTVIGAEGTMNMNTHCKDGDDLLAAYSSGMAQRLLPGEPIVMRGKRSGELIVPRRNPSGLPVVMLKATAG